MGISKSSYVEYTICPGRLFYSKHPEALEVEIQPIDERNLQTGHEVGDLAKKYYENTVEVKYEEDKTLMLAETKRLLDDSSVDVIAEATFSAANGYCQVDLLKKNGDGTYDMIEVKASSHFKDYHYTDMAFQMYVLENAGINVARAYGMHVNTAYACEENGEVNLKEYFRLDDATEEILKRKELVKDNLTEALKIANEKTIPEFSIDCHCHDPYDCPYFGQCTKSLPQDNVFNIAGMRFSSAVTLYRMGICSFNDVLARPGQVTENQFRQVFNKVMADGGCGGITINKRELMRYLNSITYPLYFLDFETFQQAIPTIPGTHAYEQIPCQYSLHYIKKKGGKLYHREFLAEEADYDVNEKGERICLGLKDPRRELAEALVRDIPKDVCTLAYNMSFEKTVIKKLAGLYPDLSDHLMNIHNNIKDLIVPFSKGWYYDAGFNGLSTIKVVLPTMFPDDPKLDYHNLDVVQNGTMAQAAYLSLTTLSESERAYVRKRLLRYCELDTYAMVKILFGLVQVVMGLDIKDTAY